MFQKNRNFHISIQCMNVRMNELDEAILLSYNEKKLNPIKNPFQIIIIIIMMIMVAWNLLQCKLSQTVQHITLTYYTRIVDLIIIIIILCIVNFNREFLNLIFIRINIDAMRKYTTVKHTAELNAKKTLHYLGNRFIRPTDQTEPDWILVHSMCVVDHYVVFCYQKHI